MNNIKEFLSKNFYQPYPNKRIWASFTNSEDPWESEWIDLTKEFANRTPVHIKVYFDKIEDDTPNLQISLLTVVDMEWMQVFWGDIKSLEDMKFIFNCIGINYTD
jgi:hypothetical protein